MKEKTRVLLGENNLLKRAVAMQHERQKNYDEICRESQHLNQLVSQYQEQLRTLEVSDRVAIEISLFMRTSPY